MRFSRRLILGACLAALASAAASGTLVAQRGGDPQRGDAQRGDQRGDQRDQRSMGATGITIFAAPNFGGPNANFRNDVPDLRRYNMNDRVDSLQVGRGEVWEACEDINYRGRCQVFSGDEANLDRVSWGGIISSLRRLATDDPRGRGRGEFLPPSRGGARLVVFDDIGFRGRSYVVTSTSTALRALSNRARSVKVYGGAWEICTADRFGGRCVTITESVPDLSRLGLRDTVKSVRPVGGRGERGR